MRPYDILIETCEWFGKNFAWNLNALPDEKLSWRPAPMANSAFEVTAHTADSLRRMRCLLVGDDEAAPVPIPTTREQAQDMIIAAANDYADFLRGLEGDQSGEVKMGDATLPRVRCLAMPVQDLVHHHGQIAYIQMLLGDTSDHFFEFENNS